MRNWRMTGDPDTQTVTVICPHPDQSETVLQGARGVTVKLQLCADCQAQWVRAQKN